MTSVLFVDDEANVLQGLRRSMRSVLQGAELLFAGSGQEALDLLARRPVDLIVSDMRMPGMSGAALLTEVASRWPDTIRFVLSGQSEEEEVFRSIGVSHRYLSKPCEATLLGRNIDDAIALRRHLGNQQLRSLLTARLAIPSDAPLYGRVTELMAQKAGRNDEVAALISTDPGLTAHILQVANSAGFGRMMRVTTVAQAISHLGLDIVRGLVLTHQVLAITASHPMAGVTAETVFAHCRGVAGLARQIALRLDQPPARADECHTAGLLHDLGILLLAAAIPGRYAGIRAGDDGDLAGVERAVIGATHADAAGYVLGLWGLPDSLVEAVVHHHDAERALARPDQPAWFVFVANCAYRGPGAAQDGDEQVRHRLAAAGLAADLVERLAPIVTDFTRPAR
jgi:HD-like signal output (HDOD) protein